MNGLGLTRPAIGKPAYIQDIKIDTLTGMISVLISPKMEWVKMTPEFALDIGFINPDKIAKIIK